MALRNKHMESRSVVQLGIVLITLALLLTACSASQPVATPDTKNTPTAKVAPDDYEGDGMEIPLDGTSLPSFYASLAQVKAHTTPESYQTLENAIDYLLFYDLGAKRDREKLAARLNGLTGYEVIAKVGWRRPAPGKGNAEKGAADVKIIDT